MPRVVFSSFSSGKWLSIISEAFISTVSAFVFFLLDFLDSSMCIFFRFVDEFLEGKTPSCYCMRNGNENQGGEKEGFLEESGLSQSLHGRKNVFRDMGLFRIPNILNKENAFPVGEKSKYNRWSDCGCESCLSWMSNGCDSRLHFVVKEPERDVLEKSTEDSEVQNVLFIHGFLSSSSLWKETVFSNLSEHAQKNCKLFAIDLLGFGRSPKPRDCQYTLNDHLEAIEKSAVLPFHLKSFHLVAHSMGCVIALALAAKYPKSVKSITLTAPPYFSSSKGDASSEALRRLATRRVWPPQLFGSAFMSWYEHLGRCVCFIICRNHRTWEWILRLLTRRRELHFMLVDLTRHTHHSAWHTMHNVICGGAKFLDKYLEILREAGIKICVIQGMEDQVVPLECSYNMKTKDPDVELDIVPDADHNTVILGRELDFTRNLESLWELVGKEENTHM